MSDENDRPAYGIGTIISHPDYGRGRVMGYEGDEYVVLFKSGETRWVSPRLAGVKEVELVGDPATDRLKVAVREVLRDYGWLDADVEMGRRWHGGTMRLIPGQEETQSRDVPLEVFFKKLIGVREKLRVLEQKINNHPSLRPEERLDLAAYLTRCYGSLTTFNVLFGSKDSYFKGQGKEE